MAHSRPKRTPVGSGGSGGGRATAMLGAILGTPVKTPDKTAMPDSFDYGQEGVDAPRPVQQPNFPQYQRPGFARNLFSGGQAGMNTANLNAQSDMARAQFQGQQVLQDSNLNGQFNNESRLANQKHGLALEQQQKQFEGQLHNETELLKLRQAGIISEQQAKAALDRNATLLTNQMQMGLQNNVVIDPGEFNTPVDGKVPLASNLRDLNPALLNSAQTRSSSEESINRLKGQQADVDLNTLNTPQGLESRNQFYVNSNLQPLFANSQSAAQTGTQIGSEARNQAEFQAQQKMGTLGLKPLQFDTAYPGADPQIFRNMPMIMAPRPTAGSAINDPKTGQLNFTPKGYSQPGVMINDGSATRPPLNTPSNRPADNNIPSTDSGVKLVPGGVIINNTFYPTKG